VIMSSFSISLVLVGFLALSACASHKKEHAHSGPESMNTSAGIQYQFAFEFFQKGDLVRALDSAFKGIEASPNSADLRNLLGLIYFRQKEYPNAEAAFRKANQLDSRLPEVYNNWGAMLYEQGKYIEARDILLKGREFPLYLNPERVHNNLGLVYEALKDRVKAEESYRAAITAKPDYFLPYQNLGRLFLQEGELGQARSNLMEATRLCVDCSEARYHLGTVFLRENRNKEAIQQFKVGADKDPKGYFGELCRQFLVGENAKAR